jgi:hypothetical protein
MLLLPPCFGSRSDAGVSTTSNLAEVTAARGNLNIVLLSKKNKPLLFFCSHSRWQQPPDAISCIAPGPLTVAPRLNTDPVPEENISHCGAVCQSASLSSPPWLFSSCRKAGVTTTAPDTRKSVYWMEPWPPTASDTTTTFTYTGASRHRHTHTHRHTHRQLSGAGAGGDTT